MRDLSSLLDEEVHDGDAEDEDADDSDDVDETHHHIHLANEQGSRICIALESEFGSRVSDTAWALNLLLLGSSSYCVLSMLNHNHQVRRAILFERVSRSVATRG